MRQYKFYKHQLPFVHGEVEYVDALFGECASDVVFIVSNGYQSQISCGVRVVIGLSMIKIIIQSNVVFADKTSLFQQFAEINYTIKTICLRKW